MCLWKCIIMVTKSMHMSKILSCAAKLLKCWENAKNLEKKLSKHRNSCFMVWGCVVWKNLCVRKSGTMVRKLAHIFENIMMSRKVLIKREKSQKMLSEYRKSWFCGVRVRCLEKSMFAKIVTSYEKIHEHVENIIQCCKIVQK